MRKSFLVIFIVFYCFVGLYAEKLGLKESINYAYQNNYQLILAQEELEIAKEQQRQAFATVFPTLSFDATYTKMKNPYSDLTESSMSGMGALLQPIYATLNMSFPQIDTSAEDEVDQYSAYLNLRQVLWGAHILPVMKSANIAYDKAILDYSRTKQNVEITIMESYFNILKVKKTIAILKKSLNLIDQHLNKVDVMIKSGLAPATALLQVQLQKANIEKQLITMEETLKLSEDAFNNALGRDLDQVVEIKDDYQDYQFSYPNSYESLLLEAKNNRKDLKSLSLLSEVLEANIHIVGSSQWPTLALQARYGWTNPESFSFNDEDLDWMVALAFSWQFFDGFNTPAKVSEAKSSLKKAQEAYKQMEQGIVLEIRKNWLDLQTKQKTLKTTEIEIAIAQKNLEATRIKFEVGAGSNLDFLDAQNSMLNAETSLINNQYDYELAKAKLNNAIGRNLYK